ncbi:unnamed protein product, partial [Rotaria sp. Silwood2]
MAALRKRHVTKRETGKTMNNSQSDLSLEDELLITVSCISIDSGDEELPAEHHGQSETFTPMRPEFSGEQGIQDTTPLVGKTLLDYFQLFLDENMMQ